MRVDVDEAWCHQMALGVDLAVPAAVHLAHRGDHAAVDRHVADPALGTGAIDDGPVPDDQLVCGHVVPLPCGRAIATCAVDGSPVAVAMNDR